MLQEEHVASGDNLGCYLIEHDKSLFTVLNSRLFLSENGGRSTVQDVERK